MSIGARRLVTRFSLLCGLFFETRELFCQNNGDVFSFNIAVAVLVEWFQIKPEFSFLPQVELMRQKKSCKFYFLKLIFNTYPKMIGQFKSGKNDLR